MIIVLKVTKSCNLRCQYCYMDLDENSTNEIMGLDIVEAIINKFGKRYDSVDFSWHGGEPTLAGIEYYKDVLELQRDFNNKYPEKQFKNSFQSNGILFTEEWLEFTRENNFSFGFSYDGHEICDGIGRMFPNQKSSGPAFRNMLKRWYQHECFSPGLICVVSQNNVHQARAIYEEFKELHIASFSLLPYQGHDAELRITPDEFFIFHKEMFDCWIQDNGENRFDRIIPFSTILTSLLGKDNHYCSWDGRCFKDMVAIEPNGGVFLCSSLFKPDHKLGNILTDSLNQIFTSENYLNAVAIQNRVLDNCKECDVFGICRGGCREAALSAFGDLEHKDPNCEGRRKLIYYILDQCLEIFDKKGKRIL